MKEHFMNATKFRELADKTEAEANDKRRPTLDNTPKRAKQAKLKRIEADRLTRTAKALRALATAAEALAVPPILQGIKSKKEVYEMVGTSIEHPSYYVVVDTGRFRDNTPRAVALRELMERDGPAISKEQQKLNHIKELEDAIRFTPIPGFFPTPPALVSRLMDLADIQPGQKCLEPSAGKGDLADAMKDKGGDVVTCEVNSTLCKILEAKGHQVINGDFLERFSVTDPTDLIGIVEPPMVKWDAIVMNPPFENLQDIAHIQHAYKLLKPGGRLVSVMSPSAWFRQDTRSRQFRDWFETINGHHYDAPSGSFKSSFTPTGVEVRIVVIDK